MSIREKRPKNSLTNVHYSTFDDKKAEIIRRILAEVELNGSARVGFHIQEVLGKVEVIKHHIKGKIEATIIQNKRFKSRPHPNFRNDFEILFNPEFHEEKENLELQKLRSENQLLADQLIEFPKVRQQRSILFFIAIVSVIINILALILRKT